MDLDCCPICKCACVSVAEAGFSQTSGILVFQLQCGLQG